MKIFVAGREGQVARCLVDAAHSRKLELVTAGRPDFDLRDFGSVAKAIARHQPDVVINAAAYTQVDNAERDEEAAFAVNAQGAANVAQVCADQKIPLLHLSTDYVFDGENTQPYRETDETSPINVYGRSKLEGEHQISIYCAKHLTLRTSWVYSPYGSNFLLTMLRLAATRPSLNVVSDQLGSPTYAPDLADALLSLAERVVQAPETIKWGAYHASGGGETTWFGFAQAIFAEAALRGLPSASVSPIGTVDYPTPAHRPRNSRLDCGKLHAEFDVKLPDWQSGVRRAIARLATKMESADTLAEQSK